MSRKTTGERIKNIIKKIREEIPDVILRTSLIVGFPGETEDDFEELKKFVKDTKWDRLGVFPYSAEDGTPAIKLKEHIDDKTKQKRYREIMRIQKRISNKKNQEMLEKELSCMIENETDDGKYYIGRSYRDVPDEDGVVFIKKDKKHKSKDFVKVLVTDSADYDLVGIEK